MVKQIKAFSRSKRKEQVINTLLILHQHEKQTEATSYGLAKRLNIEPTQRFRDMLNEMVAEGDLRCIERDQSGRWTTKFYLLAESRLITEKLYRRHISVKSRGVAVGQLEMFS
jgi:hypothetical protein